MLRLITFVGLLASVLSAATLHPLPNPVEAKRATEVAKPSRKTYSRRSYNNDGPLECVYLYEEDDQRGQQMEVCEEDRNTYVGSQLHQILSFEFACDKPCFAVLWEHEAENYSGQGPMILSNTDRDADNIDRTYFEHAEVLLQELCVEICDDYGLNGLCTYHCQDDKIPSEFVGHVKSFRYLCGDEDCDVTFWEGPSGDESYHFEEFHSEDGRDVNDVMDVNDVQNVRVEYYHRALFKQGKTPGDKPKGGKSGKRRNKKGKRPKTKKPTAKVPVFRY